MTPDTQFEQWLLAATYGLASDGVTRIRAEIGEHYRYTIASGATPEQAIAALGDPKRANRDYRNVFLTESEADYAFQVAQLRPKRSLRSALISLVLFGVWIWFSTPGATRWSMLALIWIDAPLRWFYQATTIERARRYILWDLLRAALSAVLYSMDLGASQLGSTIALALIAYFDYQQWNVLRKLAGKPAPAYVPKSLLAGPPSLPPQEVVFLRALTRSRELRLRYAMMPLIAVLAVGSGFLPLLFGGLTALMALRFLVPFIVDITPARKRWFLRAKCALAMLAVVLPLFHIFFPLPFANPGKALAYFWFWNAIFILALEMLMNWQKISLGRKLPLREWPQELYL